ncbi:MAG: hypothetical protein HC893_03945 [Chloroflexaceae bacterium]|nr:hypothetical protein [Chloroflexaceae bacterium]NJL33144.1 hypothetical protein [Chloroflexaceae bacterium]NJO04807.1 hypothetical protein [Chloroflexaceae bacterium]
MKRLITLVSLISLIFLASACVTRVPAEYDMDTDKGDYEGRTQAVVGDPSEGGFMGGEFRGQRDDLVPAANLWTGERAAPPVDEGVTPGEISEPSNYEDIDEVTGTAPMSDTATMTGTETMTDTETISEDVEELTETDTETTDS